MNRRGLIGVLAFVLALAGGVLVFLYVRDADQRALADHEPTQVIVAAREIPAGTPVGSVGPYVERRELPGVAVLPGAITQLSELPADTVASISIGAGEQLVASRFVAPEERTLDAPIEIPEEYQLLSIQLSPERVVGSRLAAGDHVGVFVSLTRIEEVVRTQPDGTDRIEERDIPLTQTIAHQVLVARVQGVPAAPSDSATADPSRETSLPGQDVIVTLAVDTPLAERIVWAKEYGSIWLSQQQPTTDTDGSELIHAGNMYE